MPRRKPGEIPLPDGWEYAYDYDGKIFFIDHLNQKTTWMDPRDVYTKPQTFADCVGNELPVGWEEAFDPHVGVYFINHIDETTQLEDPRLEWRVIQESMLHDYLHSAEESLDAKKEIYEVKQQRLHLAEDEFNHLTQALNNLNLSRSSLSSSSNSISTKYDPEMLKSDVISARNRVTRLKFELEQIQNEMNYTKRGVETLTSVKEKLSNHETGYYNINEAHAILSELRSIQKSLLQGEKEKADLIQSLVQLKDDLIRNFQDSIDFDPLSIDKISIASQTELMSTDLISIETRLAEMAKFRSEYDDARRKVQIIQSRLADLAEKVEPIEFESDKDRLLLIQEKEQLLRELRCMIKKSRTKPETEELQIECKRLEHDLNTALNLSNKAIADRLRLHEEKQVLLQQLKQTLKSMTVLESQLKSLSASTLSISSSSSLGSLSTHSSKGSLSSGLSFTDIYGGVETAAASSSCINIQPSVDMVNLQRRIEKLLSEESVNTASVSPHSSLSSISPTLSSNSPIYENLPLMPQPPSYEQAIQQQGNDNAKRNLKDLRLNISQEYLKRIQSNSTSLSPLTDLLEKSRATRFSYENMSNIEMPLSPISETPSSPNYLMINSSSSNGSNTRSVSAAVSDESVAGDSGVFEASHNKKCNTNNYRISQNLIDFDTPQLQIRLKFDVHNQILFIDIENGRNLSVLLNNTYDANQILIKVALLPPSKECAQICCTKPINDLTKSNLNETFQIPISLQKIFTKTLQISICNFQQNNIQIGSIQISLADYNLENGCLKWYNILSENNVKISAIKEESSDESTIISSQTSTLTRNQSSDVIQAAIKLEELQDRNEEVDEENVIDDDVEETEVISDLENEIEKIDKETNTDLLSRLPPTVTRTTVVTEELPINSIVIKRSQTFSPSNKNYICKLNRSDSDSAMTLYHNNRKNFVPFQRNCIERRSLRFRKHQIHNNCNTVTISKNSTNTRLTCARTSIDLELDLHAQKTRLNSLNSELNGLKDVLEQLEKAKKMNDASSIQKYLQDERIQHVITEAQMLRTAANCFEDRKVEKLLKKTSKEIYRLRKSKAGNSKPDVTTFKEKMAFFTRPNTSVPLIIPTKLEMITSLEETDIKESNNSSTIKRNYNNDKESETRYDYVVDRIFGVQV